MKRIAHRRTDHVVIPQLGTRDLRLVVALASAGTTARAAAMLHLTQPAISRALVGLETRLGVPLFDRSSRGLRPTRAGTQLLVEAERLLAELRELEARVRAPVKPPARLRLVCECYTAYHWLPSVLRGMRVTMPELDVVVALEHTRDPMDALEAGHIDAALVTAARKRRGLEEADLFTDELVFVMAATHPLAARAALTPAMLGGETLLTSHAPTPGMRWFMDPASAKGRYALQFQELPLTEAILDFTRAGQGIAVLSEWIAAPHLGRGDLVAKRLESGPLRRPWRLVWRREARAAARQLRAELLLAAP